MRRLLCQQREREWRNGGTESACSHRSPDRFFVLPPTFLGTVCCASLTSSSSVCLSHTLPLLSGRNNKNRYSNKIKVGIQVVVFSLHERTFQSHLRGVQPLPADCLTRQQFSTTTTSPGFSQTHIRTKLLITAYSSATGVSCVSLSFPSDFRTY